MGMGWFTWPRWLGQPLAQFFLIGAAIFALYTVAGRREAAPTEIRVGETELAWLRNVWAGQFGREPSPREMRAALAAYEGEEMRYREALAMGLDRDDTIVRRRLAQKYDFLLGSQVVDRDPTEAELEALYAKAPGRYAAPGTTSFCQVYFGEGAAGLARAGAAVAAAPAASAKDPDALTKGSAGLPFPRCYDAASPDTVVRDLGMIFQTNLARMPDRSWQAPVQSGYGFHAVIVTGRTPGRPLSFEEARVALAADWRAETARAAREKEEAALRKRYRVVVDQAALKRLAGEAAP